MRGSGPYRFEGDYAATSSMTAVLGRMATYSGQMVTWEEAVKSAVALAPDRYAFDAMPPAAAECRRRISRGPARREQIVLTGFGGTATVLRSVGL